jgi:hypothetical protein
LRSISASTTDRATEGPILAIGTNNYTSMVYIAELGLDPFQVEMMD